MRGCIGPTQPGQIGLAPDVEVGVDRRSCGASLGKVEGSHGRRRCGLLPLPSRSIIGAIATQRLGLRLEAASAASGVSHRPTRPSPSRRAIAWRHRVEVAALQPVGEHDHERAAREAGKARHRQERLQRIADARAAIPVGDEARGGGERLLADCAASARVTRVSRVPMVNTSTDSPACTSACASRSAPRCAPSSSRTRRSAAGRGAGAAGASRRSRRTTSPSRRIASRKVRRRSAVRPLRARHPSRAAARQRVQAALRANGAAPRPRHRRSGARTAARRPSRPRPTALRPPARKSARTRRRRTRSACSSARLSAAGRSGHGRGRCASNSASNSSRRSGGGAERGVRRAADVASICADRAARPRQGTIASAPARPRSPVARSSAARNSESGASGRGSAHAALSVIMASMRGAM